MSGFDCKFIEEPADYLQCYCPICLLIAREPYQVTCCGKNFCRDCIQQIQTRHKPCPTCKEENFNCFQNKGLQQPLYGFRVFCSNKEGGCGWQGELGQLDQHLNVDPDERKRLKGCQLTKVKCSFCAQVCQRQKLDYHQDSECSKRPYTCKMCDDYKSSYEDVTTNHAPECKCRPVVCPNTCGASNLQHQHLEEHVSSQCPLTLVACEFSDAGCDAKVYRRDLPSHLSTNMVTHMSLLARENRQLKQDFHSIKTKYEKQCQDIVELKKAMEEEKKFTPSIFKRIPPILLRYYTKHPPTEIFYSHVGGYKLQLQSKLKEESLDWTKATYQLMIQCIVTEGEFTVRLPCKFTITLRLNHKNEDYEIQYSFTSNSRPKWFEVGTVSGTFMNPPRLTMTIKNVDTI